MPASSGGAPRSRSQASVSAIVAVERAGTQPRRRRLRRVVGVEPGQLRMPHREPGLVRSRRAPEHERGVDPRRTRCRRPPRPARLPPRRPSSPARPARPRRTCRSRVPRPDRGRTRRGLARRSPGSRVRRAGGEHLATRRRPPHPLGEAVGRVVRSHDVPRAGSRAASRANRGRGLDLARNLQGPVGLLGHVLRVRERRLMGGSVLCGTDREVVGMDG